MLEKLKSIPFSILVKSRSAFSGIGLGKIPGMMPVYDYLYGFFWPENDILEVQGSKMYLNIHDKSHGMTFRYYAVNRIHEEFTTILFKKVVNEGDIVVDCGTNIGYFTLLAAKLTGKKGKVYSFEPEPKNFNFLLKNIELNSYDNVFAAQKAVSDRAGTVKLYICPYDTGHHTINQYGGIKEYRPDFIDNKKDFIEIEAVSLDDYFKDLNQPINVIKMDVEGAELLALSGMNRIIHESKNLKMFVEFFPLLIREMGGSPEEFVRRLLEDYQFSIFVIGHDYSMHDNSSNKAYLKINSVDEIMNICKGKNDHINLFLMKSEDKDDEKLFHIFSENSIK